MLETLLTGESNYIPTEIGNQTFTYSSFLVGQNGSELKSWASKLTEEEGKSNTISLYFSWQRLSKCQNKNYYFYVVNTQIFLR